MKIMVIVLLLIVSILMLFIRKLKNQISAMKKLKSTIFCIADKVAKANNINEVYSIILDAAVEIIPHASNGSILIIEDDGLFHIKAVNGFNKEIVGFTFKREETFLYPINNFKETAIIKNPTILSREIASKEKVDELKEKRALEMYSTISSPIYIDNVLIGLLNVDNTERHNDFTKDDLLIMDHIKNELQLALKNSIIHDKLKIMANFDYLTGIYNRRYFNDLLEKEVNRIYNSNSVSCLALIDIDNFKNINDTYGHTVGDKVLKEFAKQISYNMNDGDIYGRMSGDEFIILFKDTNFYSAKLKMDKLRNLIENINMLNVDFDFSYGLCEISKEDLVTVDKIFAAADKNMYDDKKRKDCRRK